MKKPLSYISRKPLAIPVILPLLFYIAASHGETFSNVEVTNDLTVSGDIIGDYASLNLLEAGDITVDNNLRVSGSTIGLGAVYGTSGPVAEFYAIDSEGVASIGWGSSMPITQWSWGDDTSTRMILDYTGALCLLEDQVGINGVTTLYLNSHGTSFFAYGLNLEGADNRMPNQTMVDSGSILNVGLADARYALLSSISMFSDKDSDAVLESLVIGPNSSNQSSLPAWVMGSNATTEQGFSYAIGNTVTSKGWTNIAIGTYSKTDGYASQAFGNSVISDGGYSQAFGLSNWAHAPVSATFNEKNVTRGFRAAAFGYYNEVNAAESFVLGRLNLISNSNNQAWLYDQELFVIGNGEFTDSIGNPSNNTVHTYVDSNFPQILEQRPYAERSNALVVYKDGRMDVIAHKYASSGAVFSVKDGTLDPQAPVTRMYVTKEGRVVAPEVLIGDGNEQLEVSTLGDMGLNETTPVDTEAPSIAFGSGVEGLSGERANTMVVRNAGDVDVAGALRVPPAGDLSMGNFTAGRDPRAALDPNGILPSNQWDN